jgi:Domain of unknown function (DUF3504)
LVIKYLCNFCFRFDELPGQGRFANLGDDDLRMLLDGRLSVNTKHVIHTSLSTFDEYVRSKGKTIAEIDQLTPDKLDSFIGRFFAEVRKTDGSLYATKSLLAIRYGVAQHYKNVLGIDIITSPQFASSREIFAAALVQLKQAGRGSVVHKEPLTTDDFNKLYSSKVLSTSNPFGLQNKVFVDVMIQLCNRGRENLREMTRDDFIVSVDSAGHRYVYIKDKQTKNHRANSDISQGGRMYETPGSERCPLAALEKYLTKLNPACMAFWQKPRRQSNESDTCWYDNVAVGKNGLYGKMQHLSKSAQLSKVYTNHCLRATCITALDQHGYEARHIMTVSGQKSEASIRAYSRNVTDTKKREMSLTLSSHTAVLPVQNQLSSPTRNHQSVTTTLCLSQEQSSATHVASANQPDSATQPVTSQRSVKTTVHLSQEHSDIPFDSQPLISASELDELLEVQHPGPTSSSSKTTVHRLYSRSINHALCSPTV